MNPFKKIDPIIDALASYLVSPSHHRAAKTGLYVLFLFLLVYIPYGVIRHVYVNGFHVISVEREIRIGEEYAGRMERHMTILADRDPKAEYINEIGHRISERNNPWGEHFRFEVIEDQQTINAFALPGGRIYITTGLLDRLDNEAELATVLGHEVAHVSRRHYARNLGREMLTSWVKTFLGGTESTMLEAGSFLTANINLLRMRQEDELEADYKGALYIYNLDYDLDATVSVTTKLLDIEKKMPDMARALSLTHPPSRERVDAMIELENTLPSQEQPTLGRDRYIKIIKQKQGSHPNQDVLRKPSS